jgi:hypothetical protein
MSAWVCIKGKLYLSLSVCFRRTQRIGRTRRSGKEVLTIVHGWGVYLSCHTCSCGCDSSISKIFGLTKIVHAYQKGLGLSV